MVVPTYGPAPFLRAAVESVAEADEILVVEDGTNDVDAASIAPARLLRVPHGGRSRARNAGVEAAAHDLVAFLDNDDLSLPGRLARQRDALERAPDAGLAFGAVRVVDGELRPLDEWREVLEPRFRRLLERGPTYASLLETRCPIYTSATMVRRGPFLDAGGFDPRFDAYEDLDLYLRLARRGPLVAIGGEPVTLYRLHGDNTPSDRLYEGMLGVIDKHLPEVAGRERRLLLERRLEALWGLGRFRDARRHARRAVGRDPGLLLSPGFLYRAAGTLAPESILRARRR